ncbi:MAG: hypothetical protein ABWK05_08345 [Pyrobaculum sp.]
MKIYAALAVFVATYSAALTLSTTTQPYALMWNGVVGAMLALALVLSVVPLAGPAIYDTAAQILTSSLNPAINLEPVVAVLKAASWVVNITFTAALILYVLQVKRAKARRVIKALLF